MYFWNKHNHKYIQGKDTEFVTYKKGRMSLCLLEKLPDSFLDYLVNSQALAIVEVYTTFTLSRSMLLTMLDSTLVFLGKFVLPII